MIQENHVAIIGGGIGGLTTALALKKAGIPATLFEAAPALKAVGAGIIMANNALQVFRQLGIHQEIYRKGNRMEEMAIVRPDFSLLSRIDLAPFEQLYGLQNHAIHRADLHDILAGAVGQEHIVLDKRLRHIRSEGAGYRLSFEDGTSMEAAYVIGADGIRSQVRQQLFSENELRDSGQVCYRGVTAYDLPARYRHTALEAWDKGRRFGMARLRDGVVYWYLVADKDLDTGAADVLRLAQGFHPLAAGLVQATPQEQVIAGPLDDLKPIYTWTKGNVCLIGDAAHATTPNMGQGACQAIEDAYVLGELLQAYPLTEAFRKYPEIRRRKAHQVVKRSWQIGKMSHARNPWVVGLRNFVLNRLTPESVSRKQLDELFTLDKIA